jgi:hypothetical protein
MVFIYLKPALILKKDTLVKQLTGNATPEYLYTYLRCKYIDKQ